MQTFKLLLGNRMKQTKFQVGAERVKKRDNGKNFTVSCCLSGVEFGRRLTRRGIFGFCSHADVTNSGARERLTSDVLIT